MKNNQTPEPTPHTGDELNAEYAFDYGKARPNRFAEQIDKSPVIVVLDPDVSEVFTTSESVNAILRALIQNMPST